MYGFVKEKSENTHISSCEVLEIENKYNINFPTMLKEYYLQHNGDKIRLCIFTVDEEEFGVAKIVELKYGNCSFEKIVKNDREDGIIDEHLYPLARNEGGDYFYWDIPFIDQTIDICFCCVIRNPAHRSPFRKTTVFAGKCKFQFTGDSFRILKKHFIKVPKTIKKNRIFIRTFCLTVMDHHRR